MKIRPTVWRRLSQVLFFVVFLVLFVKTDYSGSDEIPVAVNILFRVDPFLALASMLAVKSVVTAMLASLVTLGLTLLFGRFFCGWVCPMGALIDICGRIFGPANDKPNPQLRNLKYHLLIILLVAALFGLPLAGYLDPFSLLMRGFTFGLHPGLHHAVDSFFTMTYRQAPTWVNAVTEPVYATLKSSILPLNGRVYALSVFSTLLFLAVLAASAIERRFFCRNLCPVGAMLGLVSRFSFLRLNGGSDECGKCHHCRDVCRMGAIDDNRAIATAECTLCLDCLPECPRQRTGYGLRVRSLPGQPVSLSRRVAVSGIAAGALAPLLLPSRLLARRPDPSLIRPPGALAEPEFLGRCVRCGECMKVCIGNVLHSTWLEAGLEGVFTPRLIGRIGYCEYNCTLCGQVCPTGAIRRLTREEKHKTVIGRAYFDRNRCLPYAAGKPCIVCEEHCPTPDKAIKFRDVQVLNVKGELVEVKQPYVDETLCIGCGICENRCPLPTSAVLVTSEGESRHPRDDYGGY